MTTTTPEPATKTVEQRKATLAGAVAGQVRAGWSVESQTDYQAILVKGHRPNHLLHLILTILTLGLWLIVWAGVSIAGGEKHRVVSIDEYGNLYVS